MPDRKNGRRSRRLDFRDKSHAINGTSPADWLFLETNFPKFTPEKTTREGRQDKMNHHLGECNGPKRGRRLRTVNPRQERMGFSMRTIGSFSVCVAGASPRRRAGIPHCPAWHCSATLPHPPTLTCGEVVGGKAVSSRRKRRSHRLGKATTAPTCSTSRTQLVLDDETLRPIASTYRVGCREHEAVATRDGRMMSVNDLSAVGDDEQRRAEGSGRLRPPATRYPKG